MTDPIQALTAVELAQDEARVAKEAYVHRILVGLDQFINVLTDGQPDETISSRAARADEKGEFWGREMSKFLDLFQKDHGAKAQAGDLERADQVAKLENTT